MDNGTIYSTTIVCPRCNHKFQHSIVGNTSKDVLGTIEFVGCSRCESEIELHLNLLVESGVAELVYISCSEDNGTRRKQ